MAKIVGTRLRKQVEDKLEEEQAVFTTNTGDSLYLTFIDLKTRSNNRQKRELNVHMT